MPGAYRTTTTEPAEGNARRFRPELQGLRGVAAVLVVVYHVWLGRVSGGVDVFFLISGFLVTAQLLRAASGDGIAYAAHWARTVKRLFPAALTVLAVVTAASVVLLPEYTWFQTIREVVASALYVENWRLAADSADYFSQHNEASVVQHFWSLSIQGQFYLVWPLLVGLLAVVARRAGLELRRVLTACLLLVFAASLAFSVHLTAANQPLAYFHSLTRVWEFALGGLLALALQAVVVPVAARFALGWLGLAGLVACGLVLTVGTVFPGYLALWPTLCGAAVLAGGASGSRFGADRLLGSRPLRELGDLSYALYLWHWPVLVFYLVVRDREEVGPLGGGVVIGLSVLLAAATRRFVEEPVRRSSIGVASPWGAYRLAAVLMVPVLLGAWGWQVASERKAAHQARFVDDLDHPGAMAREPGFEYWGAEDVSIAPPLVSLPLDFAWIEGSTCAPSEHNDEVRLCRSPVDGVPEKRIVVVGDSHMQQFLAPLGPIARQRNWEVTSVLKGGCPFSSDSELMPGDPDCLRWNADVLAELLVLRPDLVLANGTRDVRVGLTEVTPPGFVAHWRTLAEAGIRVAAVRDNPRFAFSPSLCAAEHGPEAPRCGAPKAELYAADPPYALLDDVPGTVSFLDFSDYYCTADFCPPVIGNVFVYLDDNHVTATYQGTMSAVVERALEDLLDPQEG
ncbi:acyltransferase family protein [Saccharothrix longispora]|uniref:acyltransferase family protein n=1 Tax=Saccharothrix longispora TaxID=33920 RepID=UPI0028FD43B5|nr:acyltransferase family protein [Saccharothrix longispora]MBY8849552.1 acyltransferase [Saccharothrix sp. MB29]MDU0288868.1 acyltransferase family protein [Saccharothrix longispora]